MSKRLLRISTDDNIVFKYNAEAINVCFDGNYADGDWFQRATEDTHDGCMAWFPKEAVLKNGEWESGADTVNWKNQFMNNGNIIVSWLYPGEMPSKANTPPELRKTQVPLYCFWMDTTKQGYKYVGTYLCDYYASKPECKIYRRIGTEIDLKRWYNHEDFEYWNYDFEKDGQDVFKNLYIKNNYHIQKRLVKEFYKTIEETKEKENNINHLRKRVKDALKLKNLNSEESFKNIFLPSLIEFINSISSLNIDDRDVWPESLSYEDIAQFYYEILMFKPENYSHIDLLRGSYVGQIICAYILYALYDEFFLFTLSENETDFYLEKLGVKYREKDDLAEKHCLLYFWKQCNVKQFGEYTPYMFYEFLKTTFGSLVAEKDFVIVPEELLELSEIEEEKQNLEIYQESYYDFPTDFEYNKQPVEKPESRERTTKIKAPAPRDPKKKINALVKAKYSCEINPDHTSFISKTTNKPYMETHHLVPLEYWENFDGYLDTEENIVCLCSNCHNEIHYGKNPEKLIRQLYNDRCELLKEVGIDISLEDLYKLYKI